MIVVYKETDLVMHPVIQKMISVKWNKFARLKSWIELIINLVYTLIWIILALLIPRDGKFHTPLTSKPWRIVLEAIFVILSVYFAIKVCLSKFQHLLKGSVSASIPCIGYLLVSRGLAFLSPF